MILDALLERLVLLYGAPIRAVDVSGCRGGSVEESNAAGGLVRSGFTAPFKAAGICQMDEIVAAPLQEAWEGAWQQWNLLLCGPPGLALIGLAAWLVGHLADSPALGLALGVPAGLLFLRLLLPFQTGRSEITSHEISWEAQKIWPGVSDARADQCFLATLPGYDYPSFAGMSLADFKAAMTAKKAYADAWLARPEVKALCQQLAGGAK